MQTEKLAPARMHHFIADQLNDLAVRGKVLSVLVQESVYLVMLSLGDRGIAFRRLSPYDVSRSLRGDPEALAVVRAELSGMGGLATGPPTFVAPRETRHAPQH